MSRVSEQLQSDYRRDVLKKQDYRERTALRKWAIQTAISKSAIANGIGIDNETVIATAKRIVAFVEDGV